MPDIVPSPLRSQANGIINFMGGVGAILSFLVGASLYELSPAYPFWTGSALVLAIFFWFLGYTAIEAFFNLYNYNNVMIVAPFFMVVALLPMAGVKRGEAQAVEARPTGMQGPALEA